MTAWVEINPTAWNRTDGAKVRYRPASSADKAWVVHGPNGERPERRSHNRTTVKYLTATSAMQAADRKYPPISQ